jgi:putative spermidine/putrescine transport system substrate-binding protein
VERLNTILRIIGLAALASGPLAATMSTPVRAQELTIVSAGGAWQAAQRQAWYTPFAEKMGIKFNEQENSSSLALVQAMVQAHNVTLDLATVETATVLRGCDSGILQRLDYSKIADRAGFLPGAALDCGLGLDVYGDVLGYDTTVLANGPTSVLALFDTKTWPGKRGMRKVPQGNLEWALMADGVPIDHVYQVLGTPQGVDRAFAKLDTIKNDIVWWQAGAQPPQFLASREVVMTTAYNGRIQNPIDQEKKPFKIAWQNQIIEYDMVAIPKDAPHLDLAYKYLAFISQPQNNGRLGSFIPYGPVVKTAAEYVPEDTLAKLPTAPEHMGSVLVADVEFWGDHGEDLTKRFNAWLAK